MSAIHRKLPASIKIAYRKLPSIGLPLSPTQTRRPTSTLIQQRNRKVNYNISWEFRYLLLSPIWSCYQGQQGKNNCNYIMFYSVRERAEVECESCNLISCWSGQNFPISWPRSRERFSREILKYHLFTPAQGLEYGPRAQFVPMLYGPT